MSLNQAVSLNSKWESYNERLGCRSSRAVTWIILGKSIPKAVNDRLLLGGRSGTFFQQIVNKYFVEYF